MSRAISRRTFLKVIAGVSGALLLGAQSWKWLLKQQPIPGQMLGPNSLTGHRLRNSRQFGTPEKVIETDVVIVGGGMSGLSAAWWLKKNGVEKFMVLEMEKALGGNSQSGRNSISAYPWGAHYIPLPDKDTGLVRLLFEELGIIRDYDAQNLPIYDELYLCHDPEQRLFKEGKWQEGIVPQRGVRVKDKQEMERFFTRMHAFKTAVGLDGKRAFTIPLDFSSSDTEYRELDQISMTEWLSREGFQSKPLKWYVDYCCRDDYGATPDNVSAWAGIHYFAARNAVAANAEPNAVLTWPEGNGWLVNRLRTKIGEHRVRTQCMVYRLSEAGDQVRVDFIDTNLNNPVRVKAKHAIFAGPRFIAEHIIQPLQENRPKYTEYLEYAPWVVANISLKNLPTGEGAPLSWDNVSYHSQSLGYVVATHHNIKLYQKQTVLTYYCPLTNLPPCGARKEAFQRNHAEWTERIISDLKRMHPGIEREIESVDVWVWGHGMIRPSVGFIWGDARKAMQESLGNIYFAHSDMSGISIFEEAQYRGVEAAKAILSMMDMPSV